MEKKEKEREKEKEEKDIYTQIINTILYHTKYNLRRVIVICGGQ